MTGAWRTGVMAITAAGVFGLAGVMAISIPTPPPELAPGPSLAERRERFASLLTLQKQTFFAIERPLGPAGRRLAPIFQTLVRLEREQFQSEVLLRLAQARLKRLQQLALSAGTIRARLSTGVQARAVSVATQVAIQKQQARVKALVRVVAGRQSRIARTAGRLPPTPCQPVYPALIFGLDQTDAFSQNEPAGTAGAESYAPNLMGD